MAYKLSTVRDHIENLIRTEKCEQIFLDFTTVLLNFEYQGVVLSASPCITLLQYKKPARLPKSSLLMHLDACWSSDP